MSAQPEALRIADECEQSGIEWRAEVHTRLQAAAELRRLHAENEALRKDLKTEHARAMSSTKKEKTPPAEARGANSQANLDGSISR